MRDDEEHIYSLEVGNCRNFPEFEYLAVPDIKTHIWAQKEIIDFTSTVQAFPFAFLFRFILLQILRKTAIFLRKKVDLRNDS